MIKNIKTHTTKYPICITQKWQDEKVKDIWIRLLKSRRLMIVTNQVIAPLYLKKITDMFSQYGVKNIHQIILNDGETSKNINTLQLILKKLFECRLDRSSVLIALGGGVIGDLVGFAASIYQRGIDYIQVPTTLLSQVDSSIGGKTAVNFSGAKNSVGTFYHPKAVFMSTDVLSSLPKREYVSGWAEIVKYAMIYSKSFFNRLSQNIDAIQKREPFFLLDVISQSIDVKGIIVGADELEKKGSRQLLNFGHTFGHVIESFYRYEGYSHGEAVAIGMMMATRLSHEINPEGISLKNVESLANLLKAIGLPIYLENKIPQHDFWHLLSFDKKIQDGRLNMILLHEIGKAYATKQVDKDAMNQIISLTHYEK